MPPTPDQKTAFGRRLAELRQAAGFTTRPALCAALADAGFTTTPENIRGWETGQWAPSSKAELDVVETVVRAPGELAALLGWTSDANYGDRLDAVEAELTAQRQLLEALLERLPAPPPAAAPRRGAPR